MVQISFEMAWIIAERRLDTRKFDTTYPIEEHIILLSQAGHECVLRQIILPRSILLISSPHLLLEGLWIVWQQTVKIEFIPFSFGKCRTFVERRRVEKSTSGESTILRTESTQWEIREPAWLGLVHHTQRGRSTWW